jgi:DNA-directed RNA polymerase specialized sigma24 family protein
MTNTHSENESSIGWTEIGAAFRDPKLSIRTIARRHGVSDTAIRKHAKRHGWRRPAAASSDVSVGVVALARAIETQLTSIDGVFERSRRFVSAMVALGSPVSEIADALEVSEAAVRSEFAQELRG